jgi:hypothetical protein
MLLNPYEAPIEALDEKQSQAHLVLTTIGLLFGGLCDPLGGFVGGALVGLTYRLFHDISFGGDGILGLFERVDTPLEWALFHATLGTFPLALLGFVFGSIHGLCAARIRFGVGGILDYWSACLTASLLPMAVVGLATWLKGLLLVRCSAALPRRSPGQSFVSA